jgi:hypothetical protein
LNSAYPNDNICISKSKDYFTGSATTATDYALFVKVCRYQGMVANGKNERNVCTKVIHNCFA